MGKEKKGAAAPTTPAASSEAKTRVIAPDILPEGSKGRIIKNIALLAINFHCSEHVKGMSGDKAKEERKKENNKLAPKWSNKTLSKLALSAAGDDYNKLYKLAKAAGPDIAKNNYSGNVKEFIKFMKEYGGTGVRGTKDRGQAGDLAAML